MDEDDNGFPVGDDTNEEGSEVNDYSGEDSQPSLGATHPNFAEDMDSGDDEDKKPQKTGVTSTTTKDPSAMVRNFHAYCDPSSQPLELSRPDRTGVRLMDILRKNKAPIRAYKDLYEWNLKEKGKIKPYMTAKDAGDQYVSRPTLLKRLAERYGVSHMAPYEETVRLPHSKEVVKVPCHRAIDCIERLLTDPRITDDDYCFFDDDPRAPPPEDLNYVGDINTAAAYGDTYRKLVTTPGKEQLMGVIFYIDGASCGHHAHLPVTALKMSLTCFTRKARMKDHLWVPLGFIPYVKLSDMQAKRMVQESEHLESQNVHIEVADHSDSDAGPVEEDDPDDKEFSKVKAQDFHKMLSAVLKSYLALQESGFVWDMVYKGRVFPGIKYHLFCPMVKTDTEEADTLCGKYLARTKNVKHICRACHIPMDNADEYHQTYPFKTQTKIEKLIKQKNLNQLQAMSQHYLKNAWYPVRFSLGNDRGIHGACPSEMLHAILLGIFKYTRDIFFAMLGNNARVSGDFNALAKAYGKSFAHQSDRSFGSTNFTKGIREGKLMAKDFRGVLLNMAATLHSTKGRELLSEKKKFKKDHTKDDWSLLVETLLQWEAYLNEPTMLKKHLKRLPKKHKYIMYLMTQVANRTEGMGLKLMKFHAILHMVEDIMLYGVPLEHDTAANESHHKPSKAAAGMTQRNESTFDIQVARRLYEFWVLALALFEVEGKPCRWEYFFGAETVDVPWGEDGTSDGSEVQEMEVSYEQYSGSEAEVEDAQSTDTDNATYIWTGGAGIQMLWDEETNAPTFKMLSRAKDASKTHLDMDLKRFLWGLCENVGDVSILTEHQRLGNTFHGHPNYRGNGPWNDWAIVDWGAGYGKLPSHISCFVVVGSSANNIEYGGIKVKPGTYAVVESCVFEDEDPDARASDIFRALLKDMQGIDLKRRTYDSRQYYLADTEAIVEPCCVIPDIGGPLNRYFLVHARTQWAAFFTKWIEEPHALDHIDAGGDEDD